MLDNKAPQRSSPSLIQELRDAIETILYAQLGGHLQPTETGKQVLNHARDLIARVPRPYA